MRRFLAIALASVVAILGLSVAPAQAAADITKGSSCSVSANWSIKGSVNFNNTSGSPSHGIVDYVVLNSPGPMSFSTNAGLIFFTVGGAQYFSGNSWVRQDAPGYVYRNDPGNLANVQIRRVEMDPRSNTGVNCSDYSSWMTFYSSN